MNEIRIPRLGWSMEEGVFVGWLKKAGEQVAVGDPLFEMEGEKAAQEIESVDAGRLHISANCPRAGDEVKVGALLGYLLAPGEVAPIDGQDPPNLGNVEQTVAFLNQPSSDRPSVAQRETEDDSDQWHSSAQRQPRGDSYGSEVRSVATPRAKRVAAEVGVDWQTLHGSGRDGRIREADVRAAASTQPLAAPTTKTTTKRAASPQPVPVVSTRPSAAISGLSPRRKAIAERLRISRERTIPVTLTSVANATNIVALREQFKAANAKLVPALTDIVACLVARVLAQHPQMSVRWHEATEGRSLLPVSDDIAIGIAVDTRDGLLVPVVSVTQRTLLQVAQETRELIDRARSGRLLSAEMQGGVISISNLGALGIDGFTPIINYPEIAILGLGAIRREAVVLADDRIVPQSRITLSLTFDHAAIDGAPAATFLKDIVGAIENPAAYLLGE